MDISSKLLTKRKAHKQPFKKAMTQPSLKISHTGNVGFKEICFPETAHKIRFQHYCDRSVSQKQQFIFPDTIRDLSLDIDYPLHLIKLPKNLEKLSISTSEDDITQLELPESLKILRINTWKDSAFNNSSLSGFKFPSSLVELEFGYWFNGELDNADFPSTLKTITINYPSLKKDAKKIKLPTDIKVVFVQ